MRYLIQVQLKEKDNPFEGQISQVLGIHAGAKYKGPKVGAGWMGWDGYQMRPLETWPTMGEVF